MRWDVKTGADTDAGRADANNKTMIAEIPDPAAVDPSSLFLSEITNARQAFDARFAQQTQALKALVQPVAATPMIASAAEAVTSTCRNQLQVVNINDLPAACR